MGKIQPSAQKERGGLFAHKYEEMYIQYALLEISHKIIIF